MTDKTPKLLVDALGAIQLAQEFVAGTSLEGYSKDKMRRSAVEPERQLGTLGEACARGRLKPMASLHLSKKLDARHPFKIFVLCP